MSSTDDLIELVRDAAGYVDGVTGDYDDLAYGLSCGADDYARAVTAMHNAVTSAADG